MKCSDRNCAKRTAAINDFYIQDGFPPVEASIKNCGDCGRQFCSMHLTSSVWYKNGKKEKYNPPICSNCMTQRRK